MTRDKPSSSDDLFLPNFCGVRMVLALVVIGQLLAFILALAPAQHPDLWSNLSLISLFIQWTALSTVALLCLGRPWLGRLGNAGAAAASYLLVLTVTALLSEAAYWLLLSEGFATAQLGTWHWEFLLRNLTVSAIVSALALRYFYVQHQWKKNLQSEAEARVQALQSRIRPHFLFNSMNTIASLTRSNPQLAETAIEDLADLFRGSLGDARQRVPLQAELDLSHKYLHIEKLRLGERLSVVWMMDGVPQDALIPALTIQPLLENAIYHGIQTLPEGGVITIGGALEKDIIIITIDNPMPPYAQETSYQGNRIAVDNVRQRLEAYYGAQGKLVVDSGVNHGRCQVRLSFPYTVSQA